MHWLKQWRSEHQLSRKQLAEKIKKPGTISNPGSEIGCSELLIGILEGGGITHPLIADRIADVTGATSAQRDMLVHKIHYGTYRPQKIQKKGKINPRSTNADCGTEDSRPVVRIDAMLQTKHYAGIKEAATDEGCKTEVIRMRCDRALVEKRKDMMMRDHTWRYADEWDNMNRIEQMRDMVESGMYN